MPYIVDRGNVIAVNVDNKSKPLNYPMHDLNSVYTHWDDNLKRNVSTENKLNGGANNEKSSK